MDFWGNKIDISEAVARRQVEIINQFSPEKRSKIAMDFANMGIQKTLSWIQKQHPEWNEWEVRLEFVRLMYYEKGGLSERHWQHVKKEMEKRAARDWTLRFRKMMEAKGWDYNEVARYGGFKSGKVIEATISRGLPSFAKLAVVLFEQAALPVEKQS